MQSADGDLLNQCGTSYRTIEELDGAIVGRSSFKGSSVGSGPAHATPSRRVDLFAGCSAAPEQAADASQ